MNLKDLEKELLEMTKEIDKKIEKRLPIIGNRIAVRIKKRTERGYGVEEKGQSPTKFKPLKDSTIKSRTKKLKDGKLSSKTKPDLSNQIETGHMIQDMVVTNNKNTVTISPPDDRIDIALAQEEMGRTAYNLSDDDLKAIADEVGNIIDDFLNE